MPPRLLVVAGFALLAGPPTALGQSRLANDEPEIRIDSRGRNGACDVLAFSADGDTLFAAGEDKTVHRWAVGPARLAPLAGRTWNTFRERRGAIYALAHDPKHGRVAVAGFGKLNSDVAVLDLRTGDISDALSFNTEPAGSPYKAASSAVWALGFRPDGRELAVGDDAGAVWAWQPGGKAAARRVAAGTGSRVVWVGYLPDGRVAYARRDGHVCVGEGGKDRELFRFDGPIDRAFPSGDGKRLAATPPEDRAGGTKVQVRSLPDGGRPVDVPFANGRLPDRVALDATGRRLAVGVSDYAALYAAWGDRQRFPAEPPGHVEVYDLSGAAPRRVARSGDRGPGWVNQVAFHPDGKRLATADGLDHGTSLWEVAGDDLRLLDREASDTVPVWAVGLTADNRYLCLKTRHDRTPPGPNARADGDWVAFDLRQGSRGWAAGPHAPVPPDVTRDGWTVRLTGRLEQWEVEHARTKERHRLPWDAKRDVLPRCYTFLPAPRGGTWLAVGHLWGASIYELHPGKEPVRVRKLAGHAGDVLCLAPTHDGKGLVTAGRDQTVAFWNLADFDHQPLLGAAFAERAGKVRVTAVDPGSPADECGLSPGDEIAKLYVTGNVPPAKTATLTGDDMLPHLRRVRPFVELAFDFTRPGLTGVQEAKTSVLHRPVAKFVPLRGRDWVLYTYRQCYYDASANGDRAVQWLVSRDRADKTPDLLPVGDFRAALHRPDKVTAVLRQQDREPAKPALVERFPPDVELALPKAAVRDGETVTATVRVTPRPTASGRVNKVDIVEVWLNGHHRLAAEPVADRPQVAGRPVEVEVKVPASVLRKGANQLRASALARDGALARTTDPRLLTLNTTRTPARNIYGLMAGVDDYDTVFKGKFLRDLSGARDAAKLQAAFDNLRYQGWFAPGNPAQKVVHLLTDKRATRKAILAGIEAITKPAGPEDLFVLGLSGHGIILSDDGRVRTAADIMPTDDWYFATTHADGKALPVPEAKKGVWHTAPAMRQGLLSRQDILDALAELNCPTLLLIDCCHAGRVANGERAATPSITKNAADQWRPRGFGPPAVLAACDANESALDEGGDDGAIFTQFLVAGLRGQQVQADADRDGRLTAAELAAAVRDAVGKKAPTIEVDEGNGKATRGHKQTVVVCPGLREDGLTKLVLTEKKE
jgi:WD40 repeat protein